MISEGNLDLNEYQNVVDKNDNYGIWKQTDRIYNFFPIGVSIISIPFVFAAEYIFELMLYINPDLKTKLAAEGFTLINVTNYYYIIEYFIASLIVALCAALCFLICRRYVDVREAIIITFIFAFCTSLWSVAGRALWMHGPLMLALLVAIYHITSDRLNKHKVMWLGLILSFTFIIRPTGLIFFAVFLVYFISTNKKFALTYFISGAVVLGGFFLLNLSIYQNILSPYYQYYSNILSGSGFPNFFEAAAGNLISPGKGLLIFSPVLIFSGIGIYMKIKMKNFSKLDASLLIIFVLYFIAISFVTKWWDGWSFGPRYISDVLPILIFFLIPYFKYPKFFKVSERKALNIALALFVVLSFLIHTRGALSHRIWKEWNALPENIDYHPERVWDWNDMPFLR